MAKRRGSRSRTGSAPAATPRRAEARQGWWFSEAIGPQTAPQVLLGAVNGAEVIAGELLQLTRNVLVSAVSGAAEIGVQAVGATASGARGVVSAASRMVGEIATAAQTSFQDAVTSVRRAGARGLASAPPRRPLARMAGRTEEPTATPTVAIEDKSRVERVRRPRGVKRSSAAA